MKKLIFSILFLVLFVNLVFAVGQNYADMSLVEKDGVSTYTSTGAEGKVSLESNGQTLNYWNLADGSSLKTINGSVSEANLTASKDTTWTFGDQTLKVKEGTRVVYKNGKLEVFGKENQEVQLQDKNFPDEKGGKIKLGNEPIEIEGNKVTGNFEMDGIKVQGYPFGGTLSLANGGYVLNNGAADWKGLTLVTDKDLFLANSFDETNNHANWVFPEDTKLSGKGEGFVMLFNQDNKWAKIDPKDEFGIKAGKGFEFSLENRDSSDKIPLMNAKGEFTINEDSKSLYTKGGEVLMKKAEFLVPTSNPYMSPSKWSDRANLYNSNMPAFTTSPIELTVEGQKGKYLVSNFNEFAFGVPSEFEEYNSGYYKGTILPKKLSTSLTYNYPTIQSFNDKYGINIDTAGGTDFQNTLALRDLNEFLKGAPPEVIDSVKEVHLMGAQQFTNYYKSLHPQDNPKNVEGYYDPVSNSIALLSENLGEKSYIVRHETSHNYQDSLNPELQRVNNQIRGDNQKAEEINKEYTALKSAGKLTDQMDKELQSNVADLLSNIKGLIAQRETIEDNTITPFQKEWLNIVGGKEAYTGQVEEQNGEIVWINPSYISEGPGEPKNGFIRAYGAKNMNEDVATYHEKIYDSSFFDPLINPQSPKYDIKYQQKLDLLLKYNFISQSEYDGVMHRAGLK